MTGVELSIRTKVLASDLGAGRASDLGAARVQASDLGVGARAVLTDGARGRVIAVYRKAFYLRFDAGIVAVTDSTAEPGPIHLRCPVLPIARSTTEFVVRGKEMVGVESWISVRGSACAEPELTIRRETAAAVLAVLAGVRSPGLLVGDVQAVWPAYAEDLRNGDLPRAAEVLGGRGPGLTPAGDDVLAGLLLVASGLGHTGLEDLTIRTNDIAAAYLYWAARGHSVAAAHDLLAGRAGALERLLRIGASSGAALAYGMRLGLLHLPGPERSAPDDGFS